MCFLARRHLPVRLTTDEIGRVFAADKHDGKICVYDSDLYDFSEITHRSIVSPSDIKVSCNRLYVLSLHYRRRMLVLTLEGEKILSLISFELGFELLCPIFFCLDHFNNFVISDANTHSTHVFSPEGNLLHTIGGEGQQRGKFHSPQGVAITPNGRLVSVSNNLKYSHQIFY